MNKAVIYNELWRRGELSFLLHKGQKEFYNLYHDSSQKKHVWLMSRRFGKSHTLVVLAIEQCIRHPRSIVKIASPTKEQVEKNMAPLFRDILENPDNADLRCPEDIKPEWRGKSSSYIFPNGSEIHMAGTDKGNGERLRGGNAHIAMVDEAGSCSDLRNLIDSVLLPTTLKVKGKIIMASTPPTESDHEFLDFIEEADSRGTLVKKTIFDNPLLDKETIDEAIAEMGGIDSISCRREYLCHIIKDDKRSAIPEATEESLKAITKKWPRPPFFDTYVSMDIGMVDYTAVLFGYYDFRAAKVIIEDEMVIESGKLHLKTLGEDIYKKEEELWTNPIINEVNRPRLRISDNNLVAINEIYKNTNGDVNFHSTDKDDKHSAVNNLRMMLAAKQIIIHPRCVNLLRHLVNAKWDLSKKKFARSPDDSHYDTVDALVYMIRNINYTRNPYPDNYGMQPGQYYNSIRPSGQQNKQIEIYKKIFGRK